jgi:hypothetical protein
MYFLFHFGPQRVIIDMCSSAMRGFYLCVSSLAPQTHGATPLSLREKTGFFSLLIRDHIHKGFEALEVERDTLVDGPFYGRASQAGQCARQVGYYMLVRAGQVPAPPPHSLNSRITFMLGDSVHDLIQAAVKAYDPDAIFEAGWATDLVCGHADAVYHDENGQKVVLEAKSMSYRYFQHAIKTGRPKLEHILQASTSALILGADTIHIVYVCKNAPQLVDPMLEWLMPVPTTDAASAMETLEYAAVSVRDKKIPARLYRGTEIPVPADEYECCFWCPYSERCLMDGPGEVALAPTPDGHWEPLALMGESHG